MAKKKMTLEEKLEEAIVKDAPYEIPHNWVWTKLNVVCDVRDGTHDSPTYVEEGIPLVTSKNLKGGKVVFDNINYITNEDHEIISKRSRVDIGDVLFAMIGTIGNPVLINDMPREFSIKNVALFKSRNIINDKFIYYYVQSFMYMKALEKNLKGSTQKFIALGKLRESYISLPPLKEQQRIVDKIESLFENLDKAKELIEEARDDFEKRKSAILEKAFRGELTKEWRTKRGYEKTVKKLHLKEVADFKGGFAFKSNQFVDEGIQVIRMGNLYNGVLDLTRNPVYVPANIDNNIINKYRIKSGDILLTLTGTKYKRDYGYAVLIEDDKELLLNQRILNISPKENIVTSYLYYYLKSELFRDIFFSQETGGVNQGNVSGKFVENIEINIVPVEEQKEIVRILDKLLNEESKIEELTQLEEQIELIKKSILAKAFRGQLGTNCEEDESALDLLKEILSKE